MTKSELATACQVSVATIHCWLKGGLPHTRGDKGVYQFDLAAVRDWRAAGIVRTAADRDREAAHDNEEEL